MEKLWMEWSKASVKWFMIMEWFTRGCWGMERKRVKASILWMGWLYLRVISVMTRLRDRGIWDFSSTLDIRLVLALKFYKMHLILGRFPATSSMGWGRCFWMRRRRSWQSLRGVSLQESWLSTRKTTLSSDIGQLNDLIMFSHHDKMVIFLSFCLYLSYCNYFIFN